MFATCRLFPDSAGMPIDIRRNVGTPSTIHRLTVRAYCQLLEPEKLRDGIVVNARFPRTKHTQPVGTRKLL